jgi:hypothetical protein
MSSGLKKHFFQVIRVRIFNILIFNVWLTINNYESSSFINN